MSGDADDDRPVLAELASAVRARSMSSGQAAARLAPLIAAGEITIRDALDVVLPSGFAGLFVEGSVPPAELARYEVVLVDLIRAIGLERGLERVVEQLERVVHQNREDIAQAREARRLRDSRRGVRWVGGRRRILATGGADLIDGMWVAWEREDVDGMLGMSIFEHDFEAAAEAQLRAAIEAHRSDAHEPKGGLVTDDPILTAIARRVVGDAYPVGQVERNRSIEPTWIYFRVQLGLKLRRPFWWLRSDTLEVTRFLKTAARVLAAAPWECTDRMGLVIQIEGKRDAVFRPGIELEVDGHAVVFTTGDGGPAEGRDLLVLAFVAEPFEPAVREDVRPVLLEGGWKDARLYPHLQVHRGGEVDAELVDEDFDHATVLCEILLQALGEIGERTEGLVDREVRVDEFPEVSGKWTAYWYES